MLSYKKQKNIILSVFLFLPLVLMVLLLVYPTTRLFYMSFTNWDGVMPGMEYVGLDNYRMVLEDSDAWASLRNNLIYAGSGIIQNFIGLILAVILVSKIRGRNIFRAVIFLPYILNSVAVAFMFNFIFEFNRSPLNVLLKAVGLTPVDFVGSASIVNFSLAGVSFWRYLGFTMVIYIAALQSVSREIYESAEIDGAGGLQTLRYITLPSIKRVLELNLFLALSGALNAFVEAFIISKGGPGIASRTFLYSIVKNAFEGNRFSYAAAMAVILIIMTLIITGIQKKVVLKEG
jgi:raffinose/stachyose/melibiose transport system permease protein